jgi:hypothetical protein
MSTSSVINWPSFQIAYLAFPFISDPANSDAIIPNDILGFTGNGRFLVSTNAPGNGGEYAGIALTKALPGETLQVATAGLFYLMAEDDFNEGDLCQKGDADNGIIPWDGQDTVLGYVVDAVSSGNFVPVILAPGQSGANNITPVNPIQNEIPTGVVDGSNTIFTLSHLAQQVPAVYLFVSTTANGVRQLPDTDFTFDNNNQITFAVAPLVNSTVLVDYFAQGA